LRFDAASAESGLSFWGNSIGLNDRFREKQTFGNHLQRKLIFELNFTCVLYIVEIRAPKLDTVTRQLWGAHQTEKPRNYTEHPLEA
jgi:hypothetical protein